MKYKMVRSYYVCITCRACGAWTSCKQHGWKMRRKYRSKLRHVKELSPILSEVRYSKTR